MMTTNAKTMYERFNPHVRIDGPNAPDSARSWVMKLFVYDNVNDRDPARTGTGFIVNREWILTARHNFDTAEEGRRTLGVLLHPNGDAELDHDNYDTDFWFDDVFFGRADTALVHVRPNLQWRFEGRAAPINWDFNPDANIGANTVTYGFLGGVPRLGMITGTIELVRNARPTAGRTWVPEGMEVINEELPANDAVGFVNPGDSGGPVLANIEGQPEPQVVGVLRGVADVTRWNERWSPLNQEPELRRRIMGSPTEVQPGDAPDDSPSTSAICYRVNDTEPRR